MTPKIDNRSVTPAMYSIIIPEMIKHKMFNNQLR